MFKHIQMLKLLAKYRILICNVLETSLHSYIMCKKLPLDSSNKRIYCTFFPCFSLQVYASAKDSKKERKLQAVLHRPGIYLMLEQPISLTWDILNLPNPGLAETGMATANFTTKPPMRENYNMMWPNQGSLDNRVSWDSNARQSLFGL